MEYVMEYVMQLVWDMALYMISVIVNNQISKIEEKNLLEEVQLKIKSMVRNIIYTKVFSSPNPMISSSIIHRRIE